MLLRAFSEDDVPMVLDLATDSYVPFIGTLPAHADEGQARDWIHRQLGRWDEVAGYSFAVSEATAGRAVGGAGLWVAELSNASSCISSRGTSGPSAPPSALDTRGRG